VTWLKEGDQNTKFFHRRATWRAKKNSIKILKTMDDQVIQNKEEILSYAKDYYSALFTKDDTVDPTELLDIIQPKVTQEMNEALMMEFSDEEISNALFQIGPLKAPGPDGFHARFFQRNWATLRKDVINAIKKFFMEGSMPAEVNETTIVLIPKINDAIELKDFRPISLCNVVYKVVAKCMINRLRPFLQTLISHNQSAFIPGRLITDNALVAFECFHYIQRNKKLANDFCAYKLDLSKAYDRVDWNYLKGALLRMGFDRTWVKLVMECVTSVASSVRINGELTE
jgi:hypothetical protein